jgi:tRNA G18 (ribose-2'-O)-methylase SpoU
MASPKLYLLLDRIRSAYNVGSIFRSADSAAVDKLILAGFTCIPPHPKLHKTALGSLKSVSWEHHCQALPAAQHLKDSGFRLVALEPLPQAQSLYDATFTQDTCLILGHEESGVSPKLIDLSDQIVKIPHYGLKNSLNVAVAAGIAVYEFQRKRLAL